jgi:hypothetical protein
MNHTKLLHELNACTIVCNICYNACLNEEDVTMMAHCIELARECADICQLTASLLTRDSQNIDRFLSLCSEICNTCAGECEKHAYEHCRKCAQVCLKCAEMCMAEKEIDHL